jgi:preprotein translocase subunit SecG
MQTVVIVIHLMLVIALVVTVLLQRSEGGALGIGGGGGGGGGGFMTGRGSANVLTRTTAVLAVGFFATSMILTILARQEMPTRSIFDDPTFQVPQATDEMPVDGEGGSILDQLRQEEPGVPQVPQSQ